MGEQNGMILEQNGRRLCFMGMDDFSNASKEGAEDSTTLPDFGDESIVFLSFFFFWIV